MKHNYILTLLIFLSSVYSANCQTLIPNGDFELWQDVGTTNEEPTSWNGTKTGSGLSNFGPQTCFREATNPNSGNYCLKLENGNFFGTSFHAQTSTGQIHHPSSNPVDHYISTVLSNPDFNAPFTGRPDSLVGWFRFTQGGSDIGRISAYLHDNYDFQEAGQGASASHKIAEAIFNVPNANTTNWTRFAVPFTYASGAIGSATPTHILLICETSNIPGSSTVGTILWVDDLEAIYCTPTTSTLNVAECNSYTSPSGKVWTTSNTYLDTISNVSNCDSIITINLTINTPVAGTDTRTECNSYTWIDGIEYTASNNTATFNIVGGAANGCDSLVTLDLTINTVSDITTSITGTTITAINSSANYQWLDCDNNNAVINGENNQNFTATENGNYAVELTENGCADTSACVVITTVGIEENSFGNNLLVFPNPTDGNFSIDLGNVFENTHISITDITGKLIESKNVIQSQIVNLSIEEPKGIYLVSIYAGDKRAVIRLMKQ